ncbi:tyrosine-type recombinase/integrase [Sphingomonas nostoxanthinifaciens]|uniref:tyrosine-type recombinase/integrase n=1 Tax=Sphingomonas nostoxanthinifaciens TaxID=2872652 RepID=UPI001CC1CCBA|nr:tyrosine-type recombinase/integrase [Sphingomonas nostoxanthinifaciens]UAK23631.1 tyrosine-type recombinase/integrase [Sphingomonas nostoxanthinifaciens]
MFLRGCAAHLRTPILIALYTGQRRKDVVHMTWKQFQGDIVRVRQSKTSALLDIACHTELRKHLDGLKRRGVVICTTAAGKAFTENSLSQALRTAVAATEGMPANRSMHGLRYAAGSRMEEAGCTVAEIESVLGHQTFKMALKYASQRLRAKAAMQKMEAVEA